MSSPKFLEKIEKEVFYMLTRNNKQYFKKWLTHRLNHSQEKARDTFMDISGLKDKLPDQVDQASSAFDQGLTLRMRDREAKLVRKIRDALARLQDGTYGICEECGEEIPLRRLRARPVTTLCIKCKKEQETEERKRAIPSQVAY
ncbi:MAG: RNA polymerase-binding protein DksA [Desulfobacterota bacterium]|nr:RNA polymerase-binding protein DksA [Thermodesulfobacteriota bacterium]